MENLLEYAKQYNKFGFNVIPLKITNEGKKPAFGRWEHLQNSEQSMTDLEKLNWNSTVNGIGDINNNITSIDFDKCENENFILNFANELGINSWIVKTGSGFHIHLLIEDRENFIKKTDNKSYIVIKPKERLLLSHCEVRIKECYTVLPPSKHNNGSTYSFISGKPVNPPQTVSSKKVIRILQKYFIIKILDNDRISSEGEKAITELISFGVTEGNRHKALVKYFGVLFNKEFTKNVIIE